MRFVIIIAAILAAILGLAAWGPGSLNAMHFEPPLPDPALAARFETETAPLRQEREDLHGAEDLEPGPDGRLYTSLADGRIMARGPSGDWEILTHRPNVIGSWARHLSLGTSDNRKSWPTDYWQLD